MTSSWRHLLAAIAATAATAVLSLSAGCAGDDQPAPEIVDTEPQDGGEDDQDDAEDDEQDEDE